MTSTIPIARPDRDWLGRHREFLGYGFRWSAPDVSRKLNPDATGRDSGWRSVIYSYMSDAVTAAEHLYAHRVFAEDHKSDSIWARLGRLRI
jgi:hypothetical protein